MASSVAANPIVGLAPRAGHGSAPEDPTADIENINVQHYLGWIWVAFVSVFFVYQVVFHFVKYLRTLACLNNESQRYFATPHALFASFRKHFLDAPLFRTRHHREFKLSTAINVGTLPSRLQTFMLVGYFATNVGLSVWKIDWSRGFTACAGELRNRTGVMAVVNMIPLFLLAGRNNPILKLTGLTFDTMNLIHRWFGRIVVLEAVAHTAAWMANKIHTTPSKSSTGFESSSLTDRRWRRMGRHWQVHKYQPIHHERLHRNGCICIHLNSVSLSSQARFL